MPTRNICCIKPCSGPGRSIVDGVPAASVEPEFISRIQGYMAKALKEAKLNTSWIQPNENWDDAMQEFRRQDFGDEPAQ